MKYKKIIFHTIVLLLIIFPFILWFAWVLTSSKQLNILVMDKTVSSKQNTEHGGLFWLLEHEKYKKPNGDFYSTTADYFGFFPLDSSNYSVNDLSKYNNKQLDSLGNATDVAYFADTYGITNDEWLGNNQRYRYSMKLYGGLDNNDFLFLKKMTEKKKLVIAEFNFFAKPTTNEIRKKTEKLLGLKWTGWTGKYFETLDTTATPELPGWIVNLYKGKHNGEWPFKKSGIIFVKDENVVVLENQTQLIQESPQIITWKSERDKFKLPYCINYSGWFDITYPVDTTENIVSYFKINANRKGDSLLVNEGVPRVFPAVIENQNNNFFYLCGDFNDVSPGHRFIRFNGVPCFERILSCKTSIKNSSSFFWHYYYPLMKIILENK